MELEFTTNKIELPNSLGDMTLNKYFDVMRVIETIPRDTTVDDYFLTLEGQLKYFELIEAFCGNVDDLLISEMTTLGDKVIELLNNFNIPTTNNNRFEVDGIVYSTGDMMELTTGEYISLKVYQERFADDIYKYAPYILAILCRPATKYIDEETGEERWSIEKFNKKDITNLEWRANLFLNNVPAKDIIPALNFFLNMKREI